MCHITFQRVALIKEYGKRYQFDRDICSPDKAVQVFNDVLYLNESDVERFAAIYVNNKKQLVAVHTLTIGLIDCSLVSPADVYKIALLTGANGVIVAHNHPSGDPEPSRDDLCITQRLAKAGEILGVSLLDHIVIGTNTPDWISLAERGYV